MRTRGASRGHRRRRGETGLTLIELLIVMGIVGILSMIATLAYLDILERARVTKAIAEIKIIERMLVQKEIDGEPLPASLADIGWSKLDPWGSPYEYLVFTGGVGGARKDKFLKPLNTSFDLYSRGKDGDTQQSLNNKKSQDDIVRAMDGNFVGLAADF